MITISSTTGTFMGDPNGVFVDEDVTIDGSTNSLSIIGTLSYYGQIMKLSASLAMPAPTTSIQYVSVQTDNTGVITLYSDTTGNCNQLQGSNVIVLYSETIPANAVNDQAFTADSEPVLD